MVSEKERELICLAKRQVVDSYKDFVLDVIAVAIEIGKVEEMIAFIKENPSVTSSEVLIYLTQLQTEDDEKRKIMGLNPAE